MAYRLARPALRGFSSRPRGSKQATDQSSATYIISTMKNKEDRRRDALSHRSRIFALAGVPLKFYLSNSFIEISINANKKLSIFTNSQADWDYPPLLTRKILQHSK